MAHEGLLFGSPAVALVHSYDHLGSFARFCTWVKMQGPYIHCHCTLLPNFLIVSIFSDGSKTQVSKLLQMQSWS